MNKALSDVFVTTKEGIGETLGLGEKHGTSNSFQVYPVPPSPPVSSSTPSPSPSSSPSPSLNLIEKLESENPTLYFGLILVIAAVLIVAGLLVYHKKRKR